MERPLAWHHLNRLHEMVTSASIPQVAVERELIALDAIRAAAAEDKAVAEEVQALARERGWTLPAVKPYAWKLVDDTVLNSFLPRALRILARDVFELDEIRRTTDDDEVASLATRLEQERRSLEQALIAAQPQLSVPGAK